MTYCEEYAALLSAFADGEVQEKEREEILAHLDGCEGCREYLAHIMALKEELSCPVPEGEENFAARVMWRIRSEKTKKAKKNRRVGAAAMGAAACLLLILTLPQIINGMGVTMEDAGETAVMEDSACSEGAAADNAMADGMLSDEKTQAADDCVTGYNTECDTEAVAMPGAAVKKFAVEASVMEEWLDSGYEEGILRGESAEGGSEYYLEKAAYEDFRAFLLEKGIDVPEMGDS